MQKKFKTKFSGYEWILYAKSYLSLSRIGIEELEGRKYVRQLSFEHLFSYEAKHLLIPIIYNLKHGLELVLKSLNVRVSKKILMSHNTVDLQSLLKESICAAGLKISKKEKIQQLADLTAKYYELNFWHGRMVATGIVRDAKNDIFRFPDNSATFNLDRGKLKETSVAELEELKKDIKKLDNLLGILTSQIQRAKYPKLYQA